MAYLSNKMRPLWRLTLLMMLAGAAHAQSHYDITVVRGPSANIYGSALNNRGQIAGITVVDGTTQAVLYDRGSVTFLRPEGGGYTYASDLNERGQVVGQAYTSAGQSRAFLYSEGTMRDIGTLGGASSDAQGINNAGQITGSSATSSDSWHAYRYTCLLYTSPSPRDRQKSRMPSSA